MRLVICQSETRVNCELGSALFVSSSGWIHSDDRTPRAEGHIPGFRTYVTAKGSKVGNRTDKCRIAGEKQIVPADFGLRAVLVKCWNPEEVEEFWMVSEDYTREELVECYKARKPRTYPRSRR